jgi:hypothetical protein
MAKNQTEALTQTRLSLMELQFRAVFSVAKPLKKPRTFFSSMLPHSL